MIVPWKPTWTGHPGVHCQRIFWLQSSVPWFATGFVCDLNETLCHHVQIQPTKPIWTWVVYLSRSMDKRTVLGDTYFMTLKGIAYAYNHIGFSASLLRVEVFFFLFFALWLIGILVIGLWNTMIYYIYITWKDFIPYIIQPTRVRLIPANWWALRLLGSLRINPWNNSALCATFQRALDMARETQVLADLKS